MTYTNDLISVIVPIYKVEPYLPQCVSSVIAQTYDNLEIILVDDGSTDGCPAICDAFAQKDSRVKVIHKENGGLVSARKAGLEASSGRYIGYVDGDDWIEPQMYEVLYHAAAESEADIIISGHKRNFLGTTVNIGNTIACGIYTGKSLTQHIYPRMLFSGNFFQHGISTYVWNKLFKREVLYKNQMQVDDRIFVGEDAACTYPCILDADSIYVIEANLYHYRQRGNSMLKNRDTITQEYEKLRILYQYLKTRFLDSEFAGILMPQLEYFLMSLVIIRSGGVMQLSGSIKNIFPFSKAVPGSRIVIYSSGTFGQHLYSQIKATNYCEVVSWIDEDYKESQAFGLPVLAPNTIADKEYDYILIASIDETVTASIKDSLMSIGVPQSKISEINFDLSNTKETLNRLGFEVCYE